MRMRPGAVLLIGAFAGLVAVTGLVRTCVPNSPVDSFPAPESGRLDLNQATARELETLPGIGKILAERVVAVRMQAGRFTRPEELLAVRGIGSKKLARILVRCTAQQNPPAFQAAGCGNKKLNQEVRDEALYP